VAFFSLFCMFHIFVLIFESTSCDATGYIYTDGTKKQAAGECVFLGPVLFKIIQKGNVTYILVLSPLVLESTNCRRGLGLAASLPKARR
jgi:hypothetical protein